MANTEEMTGKGLPRIDRIGDEDTDAAVLKLFSLPFLKKNIVVPLKKKDGLLLVAVSDLKAVFALNEIERTAGGPVKPVLAEKQEILDAINRSFDRLSGSAREVIDGLGPEGLDSMATTWEEPKDLIDLGDEAPVIKLLNSLLFEAVRDRASDIHIEPYEKEVEVRFRVDGVLHPVLSPPKALQEALISRVKIMAGLDIAEKRLPQDGKIRLLVAGKDIYVRVSIIPTSHGERAVLRLLDSKAEVIAFPRLGLDQGQARTLESLISKNSGIILVTGPTGSGKTTTLYSALSRINSTERNIITIEDPVEYQLKGVGQMHVNPKIGLTFASGLRSILRQDPDVIMVGEIRDRETAEIAIQASLTGHLVLSTLHTNDTASSITRLVDMGIEPYLVASSITGILAQRLVRVLCPDCRKECPSGDEASLFKTPPATLWTATGCKKCLGTGFRGRVGIFEFLVPGPELRPLILKNQDSGTIRKTALAGGMRTMLEDGLEKARQGVTSVKEVMRVIQDED